jgi:maltose/maltodextrin transport system substrate-binding protein
MLQPLPKADLLERRFIDRCEDAVLIKDVCYGLPTLVETPVMICNTQLLPKPPTSFAALQSHCQLEYESGGTTSPFLFDIHSPYILSWFAGQRGSGFYPGHPVRTKENVLALELAAKMVRQASGNDDFSVDYPIFINRFQRGEVPLLLDGPWSFATLDRSNVPFEVYAPPCAPGSSGAFFSVKVLAITKNSTHPEEALKFARFLLTDDVMIRIAARGTMVPARLVPLVMLPTRTRAVLSALENAVLLPGQTNMDSFWQELSTFIHQQLHPQGEDSL